MKRLLRFFGIGTIEKKISNIRKLIGNAEKPIVFFDTDTDGSCSYLQLKKTFSNISDASPFGKSHDSQKRALDNIKNKHDLVVFFDTPYISDESFEKIKEKKIIWIDHHKLDDNSIINKYDITYLNPLDYDKKDHRCSSYWAYRICNKKENLYYAALASVADFYLLDVLAKLYEYDPSAFRLLFKMNDEKREELFRFIRSHKFNDDKTQEERKYWIQYLSYDCGLIEYKNFFDLLYKLDDIDSMRVLKRVEKLSPMELRTELSAGKGEGFEEFARVQNNYKKYIKKALDSVNNNDELIYFHHTGKMSFNRQISEELAYRLKNWKVIFTSYKKDSKEFYSCSFRGNNYDVRSLVLDSLKDLEGQGGGHEFASGALVKKMDFEVFKRRVFEKFEK